MLQSRPVGDHLRQWRQRRRMSQLTLALESDISTRHLSFVETGRSTPSRDMVLRLADQLDVPLRDRNSMLLAAGHAPVFPERPFGDAALDPAREAMGLVLRGLEPYPAIAIDRHWNLIASNGSLEPFLVGVGQELLSPPVNVLRLSLHPAGLARRIVNLAEWRFHLLERLRRQVAVFADPVLGDLLAELRGYDVPDRRTAADPAAERDGSSAVEAFVVPLRIQTNEKLLSFISTTTVFGTPVDVTLSELAIEAFLPADAATAAALADMALTRSDA
ncbi:MAG: helix-turn-helix transcriptional regulator [Chloroflexi bacterium]|nr:helix-turn-helix transcriptional regulator [Chloroflexota bacterium]